MLEAYPSAIIALRMIASWFPSKEPRMSTLSFYLVYISETMSTAFCTSLSILRVDVALKLRFVARNSQDSFVVIFKAVALTLVGRCFMKFLYRPFDGRCCERGMMFVVNWVGWSLLMAMKMCHEPLRCTYTIWASMSASVNETRTGKMSEDMSATSFMLNGCRQACGEWSNYVCKFTL